MDLKTRLTTLALGAFCAFGASANLPEVTITPLHDWTIHTSSGTWGLEGYERCTIVAYGSRHRMIRLPVYLVAGVPIILLGATGVVALHGQVLLCWTSGEPTCPPATSQPCNANPNRQHAISLIQISALRPPSSVLRLPSSAPALTSTVSAFPSPSRNSAGLSGSECVRCIEPHRFYR